MSEVPTENEAIREAVRRETARRRMLMTTYAALLLVPLSLGVYAVSRAPSEVEAVAARTVPYVLPRVREEVVPAIENTARPVVEKEVRMQLEQNLEPQLRTMQVQFTRDFDTRVIAAQRDARASAASVAKLSADVAEVSRQLAALQKSVDELRATCCGPRILRPNETVRPPR